MNFGEGAAILRLLGLGCCNSGEGLALDMRGIDAVREYRALSVRCVVKRGRAGNAGKSRL